MTTTERRFRPDGTGRRRFAPVLAELEGRELQTVAAGLFKVAVVPQVLPPTNGRFVPVTVFGQVATTGSAVPDGFFQVTDEYRRVEPSGKFGLTPAGSQYGIYHYAFRFTVNLQASRSTGTADGRHYDILVGATDATTSDGKTVAVIVPKTYPPPAPRHKVRG